MLFKLILCFILTSLFYCGYASTATCPPGAVLSPYDPNTCYLFSSNSTDYYAADDYCKSAGGQLSSVHSAFENNFFRGAASSSGANSFWLGANNNNLNGIWEWKDSSAFDWVDWGAGQPNGTAGLCLFENNDDGYWYGGGCVQARPFMCKINPSQPALASCPNEWSFYGETKNCYKVLKNITNLTCGSAFQQCGNLNATVASVHSFRENSFISGMTMTKAGNPTVIGLIADKSEWRWQDNTVLNYTRWSGSSPSQARNDSCIVLQNFEQDENWDFFQPKSTAAVICELNGYDNSRKVARDSSCPKGTVASPDNKNICYKIYSDSANWYAAEQSCLKENGHLASIHNSGENAFFLGIIPFSVPGAIDFWAGGYLNITWNWSDGSPFDFSNWAPGNPQSDSVLCMSEKVQTGYWYSSKCGDTKPYICTVPPSILPKPSCPPNFSYFHVTKKCYKIVQTNGPITDCDYAQNACFNLTSKVASIHSDEENYFIAGLAMNDTSTQYTYTAIGLVGNGNAWTWLDGSTMDYNNWFDTYLPKTTACGVMTTSFYTYYSHYMDKYNSVTQWVSLNSFTASNYTQVVCQVNAI